MKHFVITTALVLCASAASATTKECPKQGGGYMCPGNVYIDGSKASSEADAWAKAQQEQNQSQGQMQGQIATGGSSYSGGNSVRIEGDPAHTTSLGANLGINVSVPIGHGIQGASCRDTVRLAREMGQETLALNIFLECPHVRKLNLKVNPGDKS